MPTRGATARIACPAGTFSTMQVGGSASVCQPCPAGKYSPNKASGSCPVCPAGSYQPDTGKAA